MNIEGLRGNSLEGYSQYNQVNNLSVDNLTIKNTINIPNLPISSITSLSETLDTINTSFMNISDNKQNVLIAGDYISIVGNVISVDMNASVGGGGLNTLQGSDNISVFNGSINLSTTINVYKLNASIIDFSNTLPINKITNLRTTLDSKLNISDVLTTIEENSSKPIQSSAVYNRIVSLESVVVTNLNLTETYKNNASLFSLNSQAYSENACDYMDLAEGYKNETIGYKNETETFKNNTCSYTDQTLIYKNETETFKNNACVYVDNCCAYLDQINDIVGTTSFLKGSNNISINTCGEINLKSSISTTNISSSNLSSTNVSIGAILTAPNATINSVYCDTLNTKEINISASNAKLKIVDIVGNSPSIEFIQGYTTDYGGDVITDWKMGSDIDGYLSFSRANTDFYNGEVLQLNRDGNIYARYNLNVSQTLNASTIQSHNQNSCNANISIANISILNIPSGALTINNISNLTETLNTKQGILTAGTNITISGGVISSTGGGTISDTLNVSTLNASIINFSNNLPISKITNLQTTLDSKLNTSDILTTIEANSSYPIQSTAIYNRIVSLESDVVTNLNLTETYATNSSNYSLSSLTFATNSSNYSISSKTYRDQSLTYATNSSNYSISSKTYRDQSLTYATNSSIYSLSSLTYSNNAMSYRNSANTHQLNACSYMDNAYSYADDAKGYAENASTSAIIAGVAASAILLAAGIEVADSIFGFMTNIGGANAEATAAQQAAASAQQSANDASTYKGQALGYRNEASNYAEDANEYSIDARDHASNSSRYMHNTCSYMVNTCSYMDSAEDFKDDALLSRQQSSTYALNSSTYSLNSCSYMDYSIAYSDFAFTYKNNACSFADQAKIAAEASRFLTGSDNITIDPVDGEINLNSKIGVTNISSTNISALTEVSAPFGKFTTIYNSTINTSYFNMSCANATLKIIDLDNNIPCIQLIHGNNPIYGADATTDWKFQTNITGNLFIERANNGTYNGAVLNFSPNGDILANHNLSVNNAITSNLVNANIVNAEESNFSTINTCYLNATTKLEFAIDTLPVMTLTTTPKQIEDDYGDLDTIECANLELPYGDITAQTITLTTANIVDLQIPNNTLSITKIDGLQTTLDTKQGLLTAGTNISILNNVISATGGSNLTAGIGINISDNVISAFFPILLGTANVVVMNSSINLCSTINVSNINTSNLTTTTLNISNISIGNLSTTYLTTENVRLYKWNNCYNEASFGHKDTDIASQYALRHNPYGNTRLNGTNQIDFCIDTHEVITLTKQSIIVAEIFGQPIFGDVANISIPNGRLYIPNGDIYSKTINCSVANFSSINLLYNTLDIENTSGLLNALDAKQNILTAGTGITIANNVITASGGGSNLTGTSNISILNSSVNLSTTISVTNINSTGDIHSTGRIIISDLAPTLYLKDTDGRTGMIQMNDNLFYFLSGVNNSTNYDVTVNNRWPLVLNTLTNEAFFGGNISCPTTIKTNTLDVTNINSTGDIASTGRILITGVSPTLYLKDTDGRSGMIHMNNSRMFFLSGVNNSTNWTQMANSRWPLYLQTDTNEAVFGGNISCPTTITTSALTAGGLIQAEGIISKSSACITSYANTNGAFAQFGHKNLSTNGQQYALLQEDNGQTYLNAAEGQHIKIRINNSDRGYINHETAVFYNQVLGSVARIGDTGPETNSVSFGHNQLQADSTAAICQNIFGKTWVNCTAGQQLEFRRDGAYRLKLDSDGSGTFAGWCRATALKSYSDDRLKHNEIDINGLEIVRQLNPKKYDKTFEPIYDIAGNPMNDYHGVIDKEHFQEAGLIAQELLETNISWVVGEPSKCSKEGTFEPYTVDYNSIMTYGIQAIKELDIIVQRLEKRIGDVEAENDILTHRIQELENNI